MRSERLPHTKTRLNRSFHGSTFGSYWRHGLRFAFARIGPSGMMPHVYKQDGVRTCFLRATPGSARGAFHAKGREPAITINVPSGPARQTSASLSMNSRPTNGIAAGPTHLPKLRKFGGLLRKFFNWWRTSTSEPGQALRLQGRRGSRANVFA